MVKTIFEMNEIIGEKLKNNTPFSLIRLDNTIGYIFHSIFNNQPISQEFFNENTLAQGGIFPNNIDYFFNTIYPKTLESLLSCDILGFVDVSGQINNDLNFLQSFKKEHIFTNFVIVDPCVLSGKVASYSNLMNPWTKYLSGKKVLVISTHADSIKYQSKNLKNIWGSNFQNITPFEFVDCIRAPYHPMIDDRQYGINYTWLDTVESIKEKIDTYDYDVLLAGSTNQSSIFAEHAKQNGKVGIQTGGTLQLLFGLLGNRWDNTHACLEWRSCFNEHWIRPFDSDKPQHPEHFGYGYSESMYAYW